MFAFTVLHADLNKSDRRKSVLDSLAAEYIHKLLESFSREASDMGEVDECFCFVIMSFSNNPQLRDFYELGVKPTIEKLGYRCERVDEQQFNGSIRDRILTNMRAAKFIVADVTEARPNCYYELGIAHALGKEVVHLANDAADIHFDIKDFNFILYSRIADLQQKLELRIVSTIGKRA